MITPDSPSTTEQATQPDTRRTFGSVLLMIVGLLFWSVIILGPVSPLVPTIPHLKNIWLCIGPIAALCVLAPSVKAFGALLKPILVNQTETRIALCRQMKSQP